MKKVTKSIVIFLAFYFCSFTQVFGEEILQNKSMAFSTCLTVIKNSEINLSIEAKITRKEETFREAEFDLIDGTLTIKCDGGNDTFTMTSE